MSKPTAKSPIVPDFRCMREGCDGTVKIVAYFEQSPARPVGQCIACNTVHAQFDTEAFETVEVDLGEFAHRRASRQTVAVTVTPAGEELGLKKFAGTYARKQ